MAPVQSSKQSGLWGMGRLLCLDLTPALLNSIRAAVCGWSPRTPGGTDMNAPVLHCVVNAPSVELPGVCGEHGVPGGRASVCAEARSPVLAHSRGSLQSSSAGAGVGDRQDEGWSAAAVPMMGLINSA